MQAPFHIRPATMGDLAVLDALFARTYPRLLKADYAPSVLVTALPLIARANPALLRAETYYVAVSDGALLGAGGWTPERKARHGAIRHVVTDDRHLRRGIGRALMEQALDQARLAGIRHMGCQSTFTAVPFYRALGFDEIGPIEVALAPGITFPAMQMNLKLHQ